MTFYSGQSMPGTSRVIVLLYLLLVVGILVLFAPRELNTFGIAIVVVMTLLNLIFIVDIWARLLPDWTVDWDRMKTAASDATQTLASPK